MKTVLITGASSGFGKACAQLLAKNGYRLILVARRKEILEKLGKQLKTEVFVAGVDIRQRKQVVKIINDLPQKFSKIDVLINNAGLALGLEPADEAQIPDWEIMIDTNIKGLLYVTQAVLKGMKQRNQGLILNIGSVAASIPYRGGNVYGATKAFVRQLSRNLRTDLLGTNIKVTNIEPGAAETEFSLVRFKGDKQKAKNVYENTRALEADDVAQTVLWVINQPERVNIDNIEMMSIDQTYGGIAVHRKN